MRKLCIILLVIGFPIMSYSKSDFDIAKEFMTKKGIILSEESAAARGMNVPFHVFDAIDGKGYAVVENGIVIAYSTEESSDKFTIRPRARTRYELTPKTPIEPMIEAKYSQFNRPYRDSLPLIETSYGYYILPLVGCGALAVSKIMYYYKNEGCDSLEEIRFENTVYPTLKALPPTKFNWDNILAEYHEGEYTEEQGKEVSRLMKYVGYALHSEYTASSTGSWAKPQWLKKLGFSTVYSTVDEKFDIGSNEWWNSYSEWAISDHELENFLDSALEQGHPVMIGGYNEDFTVGHWQVIDGRDDTGRYHVDDTGYVIVSQEMYIEYGSQFNNGILGMIRRTWCVVPIYSPTTSVNNVTCDHNDDSVYNLQGYKVGNSLEGLKSGIYIVGRKKYIVK